MTVIHGPGGGLGPIGAAGGGRRVRPRAGFHLAEPAGKAETAAAAATGAADLSGLLAMQETGEETVRDRAARRQGRLMLDLLRALQHAVLIGRASPDDTTLTQLAELARKVPATDDLALAEALCAVRVRAAVELARREMAGSDKGLVRD